MPDSRDISRPNQNDLKTRWMWNVGKEFRMPD
jgi:hypothetical protein